MSHEQPVTVRDVQPGDEAAWRLLYSGYRAFYALPDNDVAVDTTWGWVSRREHGLRGLVAVDADGVVVALAHVRVFARPSSGRMGLYLDDLFTDPDRRGRGAARALLEHIAVLAGDEGVNVVRWITARDNAPARRVYDTHATLTPFVTYDMAPRSG
ncbi:GNAT family N-acetyltransferase [Frigoribacterium sp. 2-23]|uniref:GNAT family N-acetyltransferase n=1 Tax=Frigoribacterium sp. 2-23 TaxID=3415006 RepID=UPI003C6ECC0F